MRGTLRSRTRNVIIVIIVINMIIYTIIAIMRTSLIINVIAVNFFVKVFAWWFTKDPDGPLGLINLSHCHIDWIRL